MHLELDGHGPLHAQLTRALKSVLAGGGGIEVGRLPATRQLARDLRMSRNTVLAAYEQLRAEGFIAGRVGSGSYVTPSAAGCPRCGHKRRRCWRRSPRTNSSQIWKVASRSTSKH